MKEHAAAATGSGGLTLPSDQEIRVERIFNASRQRVWKAFTDRDQLAQWWGRGHKLEVEVLEVKKGGHWRFVEFTDQGPEGFEGRFREVTAPERLSMTFEWDGMPGYVTVETITLEDLGGNRTRVVTDMLFYTKAERDGMVKTGMEQGMMESYAALDRLLTAGR